MKKFIKMFIVIGLFSGVLCSNAYADYPTQMHFLVDGYNVYAPFVMYDNVSGAPAPFKMYFSGEYTYQAPPLTDHIYIAYSNDVLNWSNVSSVLSPSELPITGLGCPEGYVHVGDPSLIKINNIYHMCFTVERQCSAYQLQNPAPNGQTGSVGWMQYNQEIWYANSMNGINWNNFKPILFHRIYNSDDVTNAVGPSEPCLKISSEINAPGVYSLYFEDRLNCHKIQLATLDANFSAYAVKTVFTSEMTNDIDVTINPMLAKDNNGQYQLFFNSVRSSNLHSCIFKVISSNSTLFSGAAECVIDATNGSFNPNELSPGCWTPFVQFVGDDGAYLLYFGEKDEGDPGQNIMMWEMRD